MSKLQELINDLCPDGVIFEELSKYVDYVQPQKYMVSSTNYSDEHNIPVLTPGQTFILGYTNDEDGIYDVELKGPIILFDDFTTSKKWVDFNFKVKSSALKILIPKNETINFRYLYHMMEEINFDKGEHGRKWISKYSKIKVPIPPLEIQDEIVKILDNFTKLTAELTAELEKRRKQYEHYRDELLSFAEETEYVPMSKVCVSTSNIKWNDTNDKYCYIDLSSVDREQKKIKDIIIINSENAPSRAKKLVAKDDVIFATTRPTLRRFTIINDDFDNSIASTGFCVLRSNRNLVLPKWLYYCISTSKFNHYVEENQKGSAYPAVSDSIVKGFKIPIPPLTEQQRIVGILDRFDTLCSDITTGLPAEIEARNKQYVYYRNKLLTFKEL